MIVIVSGANFSFKFWKVLVYRINMWHIILSGSMKENIKKFDRERATVSVFNRLRNLAYNFINRVSKA